MLAVAAASSAAPATAAPVAFDFVGRYATGLSGNSAETVALWSTTMFVSNATAAAVDVVDVTNPAAPSLVRRVDLSSFGAEVTSVATSPDFVAAAVVADPRTGPGTVVLLDHDGTVVATAAAGAGPDALAFTPDGKRIVVANEGEPSSYGQPDSVDPEGSVSLITVPPGLANSSRTKLARLQSRLIDFRAFDVGRRRNDELPAGLRIFGPGASVAQDLEPEYVAVTPDGGAAYVTLQENNAVAVLDLPSGRIEKIVALGVKDHGVSALDPSDRDGAINIQPWSRVFGLYQPDQIAAFTAGGKTYLLTANEGDARAYTGLNEEARARDVADASVIPAAADNAKLGRLTVTTAPPATPSAQTNLYAFGTRSFSIWDASVAQVWDSDDLLEQLTARVFPGDFNSNNDANSSFDTRSDNKGPEPEGAEIGVVDGRTYAFVGLERQGGVVVADVTDPTAPTLVQYLVTRVFTGATVGPDSGPEGLSFEANGPGGRALLAVANEITGTVSLFSTAPTDGATALALLHNNDGESSLLTATAGGLTVAGVAAFKAVTDREIRGARDSAGLP